MVEKVKYFLDIALASKLEGYANARYYNNKVWYTETREEKVKNTQRYKLLTIIYGLFLKPGSIYQRALGV